MKYQSAKAFHEKMRTPFIDAPDKPDQNQDKALKRILQRHKELKTDNYLFGHNDMVFPQKVLQ